MSKTFWEDTLTRISINLAAVAVGVVLAAGPAAGIAAADTTTTNPPTTSPPPSTTTPPPTTSRTTTPLPAPSGLPGGVLLSVDPASGVPGQHVVLKLACDSGGSEPHSPALSNGRGSAAAGTSYVDATVRSDVTPGSYPVLGECRGTALRTTFTVLASVSRIPRGAPDTGGGPSDDPSAPFLVGGALVLAGAAGAGVRLLRRRTDRTVH